jgi:hypothetical protein
MAAAFTPGYTSTEIFEKTKEGNMGWTDPLFLGLIAATRVATPVEQGAATGVWLASSDEVGGCCYWERMGMRTSSADLMSEETLERLWGRWSADAGLQP